MKGRIMRLARAFAALMLLCMLATAGHAMGEARVFTYGGSGDDVLSDMVVSADGRIVLAGYTSSTDGTLASRTKSGHTGWALCVDAQGEVLWSFCTRLGDHDFLCAPVLHEDGSVTLLIKSDGSVSGFALVRLSADGEDMGRTKLTDITGGIYVRDDGYALTQLSSDATFEWNAEEYRWDGFLPTRLYGWDGALLGTLEEWAGRVTNAAGRFSVQRREGESRVYRRGDDGQDALFARIVGTAWQGGEPVPFSASGLLPLSDGGLALAGWATNGATQRREGRFIRWDVQGQLIFDMCIPGWQLYSVTETASGFAATACAVPESGMTGEQSRSVIFFDAQGIMGRVVELPSCDEATASLPIATLPDGTLALLQQTDEVLLTRDTRLILLPADGEETAVEAPETAASGRATSEARYYINPNGGKRYHTVRECSAIDEKYWPDLREVTAQWLEEAAMYERCEYCGAPPLN